MVEGFDGIEDGILLDFTAFYLAFAPSALPFSLD